MNKQWAGDAEVQLVTGAVALLQLLAAAKVDLSDPEQPGRHADPAAGVRAINAEKGL